MGCVIGFNFACTHAVYLVLYYAFFILYLISIFPCCNSSAFIYTPCLIKIYFRHSISLCLDLVLRDSQRISYVTGGTKDVCKFHCPGFKALCHGGGFIGVVNALRV